MTQMTFDGLTFNQARDGSRLTRQLSIVQSVLSDENWHSLSELAEAAACSTASASARVRDLRKAKFGAYRVDRKWIGNGVFHYRLSLTAG